jgi:hypothetical protein
MVNRVHKHCDTVSLHVQASQALSAIDNEKAEPCALCHCHAWTLQTWSCWMVADPRQGKRGAVGAGRIAEALRHWMGTAMREIKVPAKCAARLGQCFSTTVDAARVTRNQKVCTVLTAKSGCKL